MVKSVRGHGSLSSLSGASFDDDIEAARAGDRPSLPVRLIRAAKTQARASKTWRRIIRVALVMVVLLVCLGRDRTFGLFRSVSGYGDRIRAAFSRTEGPVALAAVPTAAPGPRADAQFERAGRSPIAGGIFTVPSGFASADGTYDLLIHFHGNTQLVEESLSVSGINLVGVMVNLGIGSGVYEERFGHPDALPSLLQRVQERMEKRGLADAKRGRIVLSAWSAGYGAILRILEQPRLAAQIDGVVLLDGIHAGYLPDGGINPLLTEPFERYAKLATAKDRFFYITHSNIDPIDYAGTAKTTEFILGRLGLKESTASGPTIMPKMASMKGVLPEAELIPLDARAKLDEGELHVRGYGGDQPTHHMMHLIQMSEIALPELKQWLEGKRAPQSP